MADLITPDKSKHKYVVGIDFGHGETSAAICELEWDKSAAHRLAEFSDIDIDRAARLKVIPSAICRVNGSLFIGDEAFEHTTDNDGIRICFKQKPNSMDGKQEQLMCDYMRAVYNKILENDDRLTSNNHIVYIARPSGWTDEESKELYRQIALRAGIPLSGLTSESRAAIFYAKGPRINFANEISRGAIVFDLGSSTLDFTHLSENDSPIDFGYNLGASKIDDVIYNRLMLKSPQVQSFIQEYPEYADALKFKARKFKEKAYGRNPESKSREEFSLGSVIPEQSQACDKYEDAIVTLKVSNLQELNNLIEEEISYQSELKNALIDFKDKHIKGRRIYGVFLTGGASRMNFIRPLVAETLELPIEKVKYDTDNPSLTISRGIALLGATDAITHELVTKLKGSIEGMLVDERLFKSLVDALAEKIAKEAWATVESTCDTWIKYGPGTDRDELKKKIEDNLRSFQSHCLNKTVNQTLQSFIKNENETIRKEMNQIISRYAPGREISVSSNISIENPSAVVNSLHDMIAVVNSITMSMEEIIKEVLWKAIAAVLWGVFAIPYYVLKYIFTSDESKRRDKAKSILEKESEIITKVKTSIQASLKANSTFKSQVMKSLKSYFNGVIDDNLKKVIIPIE